MYEFNRIIYGDCLEVMKEIETGSIDMILCDLPYGTSKARWDIIIPFEPLWKEYERIIKSNGAIVLTGIQPFTSELISSNKKLFRYTWVWNKKMPVGFLNAKKMPLRVHEDIAVFYKKLPTYNPIKRKGKYRNKKMGSGSDIYRDFDYNNDNYNDEYYPTSIIEISNAKQKGKLHPTEKPIDLYKYLIKTYTNEGEVVLDNCCGSGTIKVAETINRNYIGIEKDKKYYDIAVNRKIS